MESGDEASLVYIHSQWFQKNKLLFVEGTLDLIYVQIRSHGNTPEKVGHGHVIQQVTRLIRIPDSSPRLQYGGSLQKHTDL